MSNQNNDINTLREHLFATLNGLRNKTIDVSEAKAICEVGQVIINTAKVEVAFLQATGGSGTGFVPSLGMSETRTSNINNDEPITPMRAVIHRLT